MGTLIIPRHKRFQIIYLFPVYLQNEEFRTLALDFARIMISQTVDNFKRIKYSEFTTYFLLKEQRWLKETCSTTLNKI